MFPPDRQAKRAAKPEVAALESRELLATVTTFGRASATATLNLMHPFRGTALPAAIVQSPVSTSTPVVRPVASTFLPNATLGRLATSNQTMPTVRPFAGVVSSSPTLAASTDLANLALRGVATSSLARRVAAPLVVAKNSASLARLANPTTVANLTIVAKLAPRSVLTVNPSVRLVSNSTTTQSQTPVNTINQLPASLANAQQYSTAVGADSTLIQVAGSAAKVR